MSRPFRIAALIAASALAITGSVAATFGIGVGLARGTATAQDLPLPPLESSPLGGSTVYADDGTTVLAVLHASEDRKPVALSKVSKTLITAVLDTEDRRFYLHGGFDIPSTVRALAADSSGSGGIQGGSTIAQQLVKQIYLTSQRTLSRKIKEAVLAGRLEQRYSKDQILEAYLNTIYLGNGAYGVEAAANVYFGEHASQVDLPQAALLAGLIQNPSGYDPIYSPAPARTRRSEVVSRMLHYADATPAQAAAANRTPLPTTLFRPPTVGDQISDYYVQQVQTEMLGPNSPLGGTYDQRYQALFEGGLKIYTNLDPNIQASAEAAIAKDTPANNRGFQEAMVAIDPTTGKVRAMVGGSGFNQAHYDVVTQGARQPGSGFKLFTLLAALEGGYSIYDTIDSQSPCAIDFPTDHDLIKNPIHNDVRNGGGVISVIDATANSINCAFIRLAHEVGLSNVIGMAHRLGITANLPSYPSIVIGAWAVNQLQLADAYATVADGGVHHNPSFIDHVVDRSGETVYTAPDVGQRVLSAQVAREATVALQAVVQFGTGTAAALYNRPAAGKTGTTEASVDAWFNGFTPQLEATVWMGNVASEVPMYGVIGVGEVFGGTFPARTWHDFMLSALGSDPVVPFTPPDYSSLPPARYINSVALQHDDVLDHNMVAPPTTTTTTTTVPGGTTTIVPPVTVPLTTPTGVPTTTTVPRRKRH